MDAFMRFALNVREIVRKDPVLVVAIVLAIISCAAVPPDAAYAEYVDLRTIGMLFSLMTIMAGLSRLGVFRIACRHLLSAVRGPRRLALALTLLAFFSSMLITNDVALVTFVPFALLALRTLDSPRHACFTVVMMTIAANLGSMLTPIGNPQNLYLYSTSHMALTDFLLLMLPYAAAALVLLVGAIAFFGRIPEHAKEKAARSVDAGNPASSSEDGSADSPATCGEADNAASATDANETPQLASDADDPAPSPLRVLPWAALFVLALLSVAHILPYQAIVAVTIVVALAADRRALLHVDYALLFTFIAFFVFVGNVGRIEMVSTALAQLIDGHELAVSVIASQVLSNVPAAILLSGFTSYFAALIVGTNLGGLGTLIASMASLISYKQVALVLPREKGRYFMLFTVWNIAFLAVLAVLAAVLEVL
ncbi:SLC13 family permease [Enorma massiliensis]|uniref:SLC13 family permease n=1 Tax=Enorma massiliensis TaxID=1472761 RepID=UPI00030339A0|nr:SLC13 family permease [Enorma massiliensis]